MDSSIFSSEHRQIVDNLVKARKDCGLSQSDVARLLGRTQSFISKLESGQKKIDVLTLKSLADVYKKSINFFVKDSEEITK